MNRFSIITVCLNSAPTIRDTIESVLAQTLPPFEYIIVDGGSTDGTAETVRSYRDSFIKKGIEFVFITERDEGIYDAMNKGIRAARGDIIGLINSDDWYEREALETVSRCYDRTHFELFYADLRMHLPNGKSFIKRARNRRYATSRDWNHPTTFITADIYSRYLYRNETIHDDYELILRLKKAGVRTAVENRVLANFRMNGKSHERNIKKALSRCMIKYRIYRENGYSPLYFFECFGVELAKLIVG